MNNDEYISIKEFADKSGTSPQNIYQRMKQGSLNQFVKSLNGKKYINIKALELFDQSNFKSNSTCLKKVEQELESSLKLLDNEREKNKELSNEIELLKVEKQDLTKQIFDLNKKIQEYADKFSNLAEQQQTLNLLAVAKKKNIFLRLFGKKDHS